MKGDLLQNPVFAAKTAKRKRTWRKVVTVMAAIVVFCTVYALVLPAITLGEDPVCALQEHTHTPECYNNLSITPLCPATQELGAVLHTHDQSCYDKFGALVCPLPEQIEHIHGEACWQAQSTLTCLLEEIAAHSHDESCYGDVQVLSCGKEPCEGHAHGEACYEGETLICELPEEEAHAHSEDCYITERGLVCTLSETLGHSHDESCYEMKEQLICTKEQIAEHIHGDSCLNEQGIVICGITPATIHVHTEDCFLVKELEQPVLACTLEEHSHGDACFPQQEGTEEKDPYICGLGFHGHKEECYDAEGNLTCTMTEHVHVAACLIADYDPAADMETSADWEASFAHVELTGNWPKDILAIAESQLGYEESKKNAVLGEDGVLRGYTRYGDWYGSSYGDWCAMFVSFCLEYAGAGELPQDALCNTYIEQLEEAGLYRLPNEYLPKAGDIIFFDWERTGGEYNDVDHVGLVAELIYDEEGKPVKIKTIEGNSDARVQYREYSVDSTIIVGYGDVPPGGESALLCEKGVHVHGNECFDEENNVTCQMQEHSHSDDCYGRSFYYEDEQLMAQLIVGGVDELPEDLSFTVIPVTEESDPERHALLSISLEDAIADSKRFVGDAGFYHVELMSGGEKYELSEAAVAVLDMTFVRPVFAAEDVAEGSGLFTYQMEKGEPIALFSGEMIDTYEATASQGESYENATEGLTGLRVSLKNGGDVAVMIASTKITGNFWTRVTNTSQLNKNDTYMIISAEGNYALRGNTSSSSNYGAVLLETVKGNTQYYTVKLRSGNLDKSYYWIITPGNNNQFTLRNQSTSNYVYMAKRYSSYPAIYSSSANLTLTYYTPENCWRIKNASTGYCLRNQGTGSFATVNKEDSSSYNVKEYYSQDMLIFKLDTEVTELYIPDDVTSGGGVGGTNGNTPTKPDYAPFIEPSDEKTGNTVFTDPNDPNVSVSGKYYSDKATSNIEKDFDLDNYEKNKENDGKILTDKSVVYMDDDYGAFSSYDANTFGITLSALGQEYEMPDTDVVRTPIDVVFVLDVSGSMTTNKDGGKTSRVENMVKACNESIKQIMDDHPANRIGIVLYATGAWKLLPLDRYQANNDEYLKVKSITGPQQNDSSIQRTIHFLETAASLKTEKGESYASLGTGFNQGYGTYTQAGIALGYETFEAVTDLTYTAYFGEGEDARSYTVIRQPVFVLLSDGEPTHSTNLYMDPISAPHYGDGNGGASNAKGIHGYNTILSANYFKRMVGIHYGTVPLFYTVGMGINTEEQGDGPQVTSSETGDNYKRAVLNPTEEIIANLTSNKNKSTTVDQLRNMLNGNFTSNAVSVLSNWPDPWTGIPHTQAPVLRGNPYAGDYSYADNAWFGKLDDKQLADIFSQILQNSAKSTPYGFILHKASSITLTDQIGEGMELQGPPVLRFAGTNYSPTSAKTEGNVTHYYYTGTYTHPHLRQRIYDLSEIDVTVTTDDTGIQTVNMYIPDSALMGYTPNLNGKFYYEALPVRLIYQVGLTAEAKQQVLELAKTGGELTFYTNAWEGDNGQSSAHLYPSLENPYYYEVLESTGDTRYHEHHDLKEEGTNLSDTLDYSVDSHKEKEYYDGELITMVLHKLGNNGKLVFEVPVVEIPVEKQWENEVRPPQGTEVELAIYSVIPGENGTEEITYIKSVMLSADHGWKGKFEGMAVLEEGYYAIVEKVPLGYHARYEGETVILTIDQKRVAAVKVDLSDPEAIPTVVIVNIAEIIIPETGGSGKELYWAFGVLLIAVALGYLVGNVRLRRKEGS